jgi:hypothetical protein
VGRSYLGYLGEDGAYASPSRRAIVDRAVTRSEVPMEKMNREQRRREKYGHAGGATKEPWPQSEANPVFGQADDAAEDGGKTADDAATAVPSKKAAPKSGPARAATGAIKAVDRKVSKPDDSAKG